MMMVGSVSEVTVLSTLADQIMVAFVADRERKDRRRIFDIQGLPRHGRPCSIWR